MSISTTTNPLVRFGLIFLVLFLVFLPASSPRPLSSPNSAAEAIPAGLMARLRELGQRFPGDDPQRPLTFPSDHGAHERAAAELWDFAGQMSDPDGRRYGFRLSFARLGLSPTPPQRPSAWATGAVYRGLFALTDATAGWTRSKERFERAALNLSGYDPGSGRLWLDAWTLQVLAGTPSAFALRAGIAGNGIDLRLRSLKPAALPEAAGFPSGPDARAYLLSRLEVSGTIETGGQIRPVSGLAWLSRTWGRLLPPGGQVAFDRYQLQLDDGRELLILQLRRRDGSSEPLARGLWIDTEGKMQALGREDLRLEATGYPASPDGKTKYPLHWAIRLPALGTELHLSPLVENQEIEGKMRTRSGFIRIEGNEVSGRPLAGAGFMELDGD